MIALHKEGGLLMCEIWNERRHWSKASQSAAVGSCANASPRGVSEIPPRFSPSVELRGVSRS